MFSDEHRVAAVLPRAKGPWDHFLITFWPICGDGQFAPGETNLSWPSLGIWYTRGSRSTNVTTRENG